MVLRSTSKQENTMENKKPTKNVLIAEIMATPTPTGGEFDVRSLERTNVSNLQLILDILGAPAKAQLRVATAGGESSLFLCLDT